MQFVYGVVSAAGGIITSSNREFRVTVIQKRVLHYSNYYIEFVPPLDSTPAVFGNQLYPNISYNSVERGGKTTDNVVISEVSPNGFYMGTADYLSNGHASTVPRNFSFVAIAAVTTSEPDQEPTVVSGCVSHDGSQFLYTQADVAPRVTKIDTGIYDIQFPELKFLPAVIVTQNRCMTDLNPGNTRDNDVLLFSSHGIPEPISNEVGERRERHKNSTRDNAILTGISKSAIRVKTGDSNGDAADRSFNFIILSNSPTPNPTRHQFFFTGVLLANQNDHADVSKRFVAHMNGMGEIFFGKPYPSTPVVIAQQRFKSSHDGIGSGLDNAIVTRVTPTSAVVETGDANGWLAPRFVYVLAFGLV